MQLIASLSNRAPYVLALIFAALALALHWLVIPFVGARIPYIFFLVAIGLAAFYSGRGPALIVVAAGAASASAQFFAYGAAGRSLPEQITLVIYLLCGTGLVVIGQRFRVLHRDTQQNVTDLEDLHDLSVSLAVTPRLCDQLNLILARLATMQRATHAVLLFDDRASNDSRIVASLGFSEAALVELGSNRALVQGGGLGESERQRLIVPDTEQPSCSDALRELGRREGFRAMLGTPVISGEAQMLGVIALYFPEPHLPGKREMRLAEICARKVVVHLDRERAEAVAREGDQRLRAVIDSSAVPFNVLSPVRGTSGAIIDFRWMYANAQAGKVLGRDPASLIGKRVQEVLPETWQAEGLFENYVAVAERREVRELELYSNVNGIMGWFHLVVSPLDGNVAVWFANVSDRKRQELELREADRRKDEFLATLAHELRNPLAPIRQAAVIASRSNVTEAQRKWSHEVIERQVQHMALLLDDLLDVSRITRGVLQLRKQRVSLRTLVDAAIETARPFIELKRHRLEVKILHEDVVLNVDPLRMAQVISNLLNNAAKYTNTGGTIWLTARVDGGELKVCVDDTGIGIAEDDLQSIFGMFAQVTSAQERSEGGLGIGLALTKGLVELHGGRISVKSAGPGQGSSFIVCIPDAIATSIEQLSYGAAPTRPTLSRRIVVADDNQDAARSLYILLSSDGHEVHVAHDGAAAVELFERVAPDVMILDIGMPHLSGYDVARHVRSHDADRHALLIAITGWGQSADRARSDEAGFDHHLTKPVDYDYLSQLLAPDSKRRKRAGA
jgi:PAS domain S-box-containing protein